MKNGLLRDLVILICSKRNFWQPLSTRIFSRVLWCAEIAAVLTFWAFRGEINSCKGLTMTMAMRQPLIENNSWLFEDLRSYNHVWSKDLNAFFFDNITLIQLEFPKITLDNLQLDDFCFQSRVAFFFTFRFCDYITCCFFKMKIYPPCQSTWNLKISHWERAFVLKTIIPSFHVRFRGCIIGSLTIAPIDITQK